MRFNAHVTAPHSPETVLVCERFKFAPAIVIMCFECELLTFCVLGLGSNVLTSEISTSLVGSNSFIREMESATTPHITRTSKPTTHKKYVHACHMIILDYTLFSSA
jgi:hypothetical protein